MGSDSASWLPPEVMAPGATATTRMPSGASSRAMARAAARPTRNVASRLTPKWDRQSSQAQVEERPLLVHPALLTQTDTGPQAACPSAKSRSTSASSLTSASISTAVEPTSSMARSVSAPVTNATRPANGR